MIPRVESCPKSGSRYKLIGEVKASAVYKEDLPSLSEDYQVIKKKITMVMGVANPLDSDAICDEKFEDVIFTAAELRRDFIVMNSETLLLICKYEDSPPTETVNKIIKKFQIKAYNDRANIT